MRSRFPNPVGPRCWCGPRSPTPCPARARCSSRWRPARSTAPTCCSGRASTTRRPAPPRTPGWSARAGSPRSGPGVTGWSVGDEVCALLAGGGYAREGRRPGRAAAARARRASTWSRRPRCPRWPARSGRTSSWSPTCARARRCWCTAAPAASARWRSSSPRRVGARVAVTAGTPEKLDALRASWAPTSLINYREQDFVEELAAGDRRARAPTSSSTSWARSTWTATCEALAVNGRLVDHRPAGRRQGRAQPRRAAGQARRDHARPRCAPGRSARRPRSSPPYASTSGRWSRPARSGRSSTARCR